MFNCRFLTNDLYAQELKTFWTIKLYKSLQQPHTPHPSPITLSTGLIPLYSNLICFHQDMNRSSCSQAEIKQTFAYHSPLSRQNVK